MGSTTPRGREPRDAVDRIVEQWRRERPDLDLLPMAVIARISRISRILERSIEEVYALYGLNRGGFAVLAALRRAGPPYTLSPTDLYNSLLLSSGAMTNRLRRLTAAGLVSRSPDPTDGRSMLVALTPEGLRRIEEAITAHMRNEQRLLAALPRPERELLAGLLRKLLVGVEGNGTRGETGTTTIVSARAPEARAPRSGGDGRPARPRRRSPT